MSLDYLLISIVSLITIENFHLDRYASPVGIYHPFYSELFSPENIVRAFIRLLAAGLIVIGFISIMS